jgi:hypothetical protein
MTMTVSMLAIDLAKGIHRTHHTRSGGGPQHLDASERKGEAF